MPNVAFWCLIAFFYEDDPFITESRWIVWKAYVEFLILSLVSIFASAFRQIACIQLIHKSMGKQML